MYLVGIFWFTGKLNTYVKGFMVYVRAKMIYILRNGKQFVERGGR